MPDDTSLYRMLYRIRRFEETVLENFSSGLFYGTTHTYLGQEADAVGVLTHLEPEDIVFSNHRCHGHFLAYGGDMFALFAELMGKPDGVTGGRGGSQHVHWKNFYSNGILGSTAPVAAGTALAEKFKGRAAVTVVFLGDGALGEGVLYETFNLASLWSIPILFVLENNRIAQTTPIELALAGDISARFDSFLIPSLELDTSDVHDILPAAAEMLAHTRQHRSPAALILHTCRFGPHSKGDDTRPPEQIDELRASRDPVAIQAARLPQKDLKSIREQIDAEVAQAFQRAKDAPSHPAQMPQAL